MVAVQTQTPAAPLAMQGVIVPSGVVNTKAWRSRTRRHTQQEKTWAYSGQPSDVIELRKNDILANIYVNFVGTLTVTPGTGTVASTAKWPYDFIKSAKFTANGASNLINCRGSVLRARSIMKNTDLTDRGVSQTIGGTARTQGTMALASESWGVGSNTTGLAAGTYDVDLTWEIPVAEDLVDLVGAIFLATATADLTVELNYDLDGCFAKTGDATYTLTGSFQVETLKFSIPVDNGSLIVPEGLAAFHSLIESRYSGLQTGGQEPRLVGQGAGKSLLRLITQHWAGATPAPLPMNATNFGELAWRYGNSENPDVHVDGNSMRRELERLYNADLGGLWGWGAFDFVSRDSFRDVVDLGTTSDLRVLSTIQSGVDLTNSALQYAMESVFAAGQAA